MELQQEHPHLAPVDLAAVVDIEPGEVDALKSEARMDTEADSKEEEQIDLENTGRGKRERKAVDYVKLAEQDEMVCMMSDDEDEAGEWKEGSKEDEDFTAGFFQALAAGKG